MSVLTVFIKLWLQTYIRCMFCAAVVGQFIVGLFYSTTSMKRALFLAVGCNGFSDTVAGVTTDAKFVTSHCDTRGGVFL
jgi:hypothetical protein